MKSVPLDCTNLRVLKQCTEHKILNISEYLASKYNMTYSTFGTKIYNFIKQLNQQHFFNDNSEMKYNSLEYH